MDVGLTKLAKINGRFATFQVIPHDERINPNKTVA